MVKFLLKLAISALIANAAWRLGTAYAQFYRFKDAVAETAQFGGDKPSREIERRIIGLASEYDVPLTPAGFTVRRDDRHHTVIDGSYTTPIDFAPGYSRPWLFEFHVDIFTLQTAPPDPPR